MPLVLSGGQSTIPSSKWFPCKMTQTAFLGFFLVRTRNGGLHAMVVHLVLQRTLEDLISANDYHPNVCKGAAFASASIMAFGFSKPLIPSLPSKTRQRGRPIVDVSSNANVQRRAKWLYLKNNPSQ